MLGALGLGAGSARSFARKVAGRFHADPRSRLRQEVPAFDALIDALHGHSEVATVRFHGRKHVEFSPSDPSLLRVGGRPMRHTPRCELCDLALIAFDPIARRARLTFVQVKMERVRVKNCLSRAFGCDPEQWVLLAMRPLITNQRQSGVPAGILREALIPSIGSFLFFSSQCVGTRPQTFYSAADLLEPATWTAPKRGRLTRSPYPRVEVKFTPHLEITYAKNLSAWLASAHALLVGDELDLARSPLVSEWLRRMVPILTKNVDGPRASTIRELARFVERDRGTEVFGTSAPLWTPRAIAVVRGKALGQDLGDRAT